MERTKKVLERIKEMTCVDNAMAPDAVSEAVYELLVNEGFDDDTAEKASTAAFELASALVLQPGEYI